jgi:FtsH-binding integral membrane protein
MTLRTYTASSIALFLFAYMSHYAYKTQTKLPPLNIVFSLICIVLLFACISLFLALKRKVKNVAFLFLTLFVFYGSTLALFVNDYIYKTENQTLFILHIIAWVILAFGISLPSEKQYSIPFVVTLLLGLIITRKAREHNITDHPGYMIMFMSWLAIIHGVRNPSSTDILIGIR